MLRSADIDVKIWPMPVEIPESNSIRSGSHSIAPTIPMRQQVLAHPALRRCGLTTIQIAIHRQEQPGAFLLGKFRSCRHAIFRPQGAAPRWSRRHHARSILARSQQRWLLARSRHCRSGILLVHGSGAGRDSATHKSCPPARIMTMASANSSLMYDDIRAAASPSDTLLDFCQSTYEAGADRRQMGPRKP